MEHRTVVFFGRRSSLKRELKESSLNQTSLNCRKRTQKNFNVLDPTHRGTPLTGLLISISSPSSPNAKKTQAWAVCCASVVT
jgi:hypothetical protein